MKLLKFRVRNFRSAEDSGWIETDNVTALIGTNESGKTNLLVPLWKLKPAKEGEINPIADYPRKRYNEIRSMAKKPEFIEAHFELPDALAVQVAQLTGTRVEDVRVASVTRDLAGNYYVGFPLASPVRTVSKSEVLRLLSDAHDQIGRLEISKAEEELRVGMLSALAAGQGEPNIAQGDVDVQVLRRIEATLNGVDVTKAPKRSVIAPRYGQVVDAVKEMIDAVSKPHPYQNAEARSLVVKSIPPFVYYSNYGNLDSEIYLPHVIQNMQRTDLGSREEAKARTLKVLFEFVKLRPEEILELGQDFPAGLGEPTADQIKAIAAKKTEREILLQSASVDLTKEFRSWWKQGDYRFRFQADGNHFRIWVSDDRRPEEVELEGRSSGLQWFLSFYLTFLVESADAHEGAILLLDEPGLSLHPIAQRDLSEFFESLSKTNQILYTTHSPFMVDPDHLDRVRAVYVDDQGATAVSANLRAGEGHSAQSQSIYPVHAALGLSVSDILLQGCQPVIVEGPSNQLYLSALKNYLISKGLITPKRELVFVPAGGVRGVSAVVSILTGRDEALPHVVLDSDASGQSLLKQLTSGLYRGAVDRLIAVGDILGLPGAEIEDLFPTEFLARVVARSLRAPRTEEDFDEVVVCNQPIVPQIEAYAKKYDIPLALGWKVDIAKAAKDRLLKGSDPIKGCDTVLEKWKALFLQLDS